MKLTNENLKGKVEISFEALHLSDDLKATIMGECHIRGDIYLIAQNISEMMMAREKLADLFLLTCDLYIQKKQGK